MSKELKRYYIFVGATHYPSGGWDDFKDSKDTIEEAGAFMEGCVMADALKWAHVYDSETGEILRFGERG